MECAFALFFSLQILFEHLFFLLYFFSKVLLLLKELLERPRSSLAWCFGFECALSINLPLLFLLKLPNLSILFCESLADLLADRVLLLLEHLDSSLLSQTFFLDQLLEVEEDSFLTASRDPWGDNGRIHLWDWDRCDWFSHDFLVKIILVEHFSYLFKL